MTTIIFTQSPQDSYPMAHIQQHTATAYLFNILMNLLHKLHRSCKFLCNIDMLGGFHNSLSHGTFVLADLLNDFLILRDFIIHIECETLESLVVRQRVHNTVMKPLYQSSQQHISSIVSLLSESEWFPTSRASRVCVVPDGWWVVDKRVDVNLTPRACRLPHTLCGAQSIHAAQRRSRK